MAITQTGENAGASYEIRADRATNRLYLSFEGRLTAGEMETAASETLDAADRLDDGFAIVNDISTFAPPSPEAAAPIEDAQGELAEMGLGDVVRVVGTETSRVTENAFQRRSRQAGYEGETAPTVSAAEQRLD
ncbi:hypothetical protein [Haloarcula litorea]|uniref:hypothetical protein n=1 Tax=Haloarcula litorea TaxID=3032579 RepID=UPI0023E87CD5|nr:hypothetical protein [Halomicroarcula sp. GDY20]